ncbi:MAG: DinB family protein [Ardenticatenaceae bacterium]|nr:DinB family protein [Anaerolineales bacterium]MCB8916901.1 DinB family protein [Ardenticatenaceae bacterium]
MLAFERVRRREISLAELVADLTVDDLRDLTNEMVDTMLALLAGCVDADVTFEPEDPDAHDGAAADEGEVALPWTLGHVIVHATASAEESAFLAAELARGVENHGRSRYEVPWQTVTTVAQCRARLEESRRMRLASLAMWPDEPHLDNTYLPWPTARPMNATGRFVSGLWHDWSHLGQIAEVIRQASVARVAV